MALECGPTNAYRHAIDFRVNDPAAAANEYAGDTLHYEISTDGGATWADACYTSDPEVDCVGNCTGVHNIGGAAAGLVTATYIVGLTSGTAYTLRMTITASSTPAHVGQTVTCGPVSTDAVPTGTACISGAVTNTSGVGGYGILGGAVEFFDCNADTVVWGISTTPGGPYTDAPSEAVTDASPDHSFTGLSPGTTYYYRGVLSSPIDGANYLTGTECSFTTTGVAVSEPNFIPTPCASCGEGAAGGGDAESNILCDYVNGEVVGSAIAVYNFDDNGNPTGPPTLVIPGTDDPYVPQGTMMVCPGELGCLEPVEFCFTTTTTGPVDHPGRQYDITLPINPGFAVQSLLVDATTYDANILWDVADPDGEQFRTDLTAFLEGRLPAAATVTITNPNAGAQVCGAAQPMTIHIECLRLDTNPPNLVELVYNGGQDVIINPAYNETPPLNPPVSQGDYGFHLLGRQDNNTYPQNQPANRANCTNVANRGWETNDVGRTFEIWGRNIVQGENVTPTPRGTPVQEMTSDGAPPGGVSTIWQTFQAPTTGNFVVRVVHGGRDAGETHRITLDNGDSDDAQNGDLIDNTVANIPQVTTNGGNPRNPWTEFQQTLPLTNGSTYTLALSSTNPVVFNRGGLFTDMRAYIDRPDLRATAVTDDDTCVVTVDETTTVQDAQWWSPVCNNGDIDAWKNAETGQILTNTQFWGQSPAPGRCSDTSTGGTGGSVAANLVHNYEVCATLINGTQTTANRVVITDPSGGVLASTFIGNDGGPITPASWTMGKCESQQFVNDEVLCDTAPNGTVTTFLRKYVQSIGAGNVGTVVGFRDFTLSGTTYSTSVGGSVGNCQDTPVGWEPVCYTLDGGTTVLPGTKRHQDNFPPPGFMVFAADGTRVDNQPGYEQTLCTSSECCPVVVSDELCYDSGAGVQPASSIRLADGTIQIIDQATGAVVAPGDVVACTTVLTAQHRLIGDADTPWTPATDVAGATLTGVSFTVLSGTATVTDQSGTVATGLPAGVSGDWQAEDGNTLSGPQSIDAVGGQTYVTWTTR